MCFRNVIKFQDGWLVDCVDVNWEVYDGLQESPLNICFRKLVNGYLFNGMNSYCWRRNITLITPWCKFRYYINFHYFFPVIIFLIHKIWKITKPNGRMFLKQTSIEIWYCTPKFIYYRYLDDIFRNLSYTSGCGIRNTRYMYLVL